MSELITIGAGSETVHGSLAAAQAYVDTMLGDRYETWAALASTDLNKQKKSLVNAVRYLNSLVWQADYDTFAKREAFLDAAGKSIFHNAQYELAVLIVEDSEVTDVVNQGSNIQSLGAGSASVSFFNPDTKEADPLPPVLMRLVGQYLSASTTSGPVGGTGQSGSSSNPFASCNDLDRGTPY